MADCTHTTSSRKVFVQTWKRVDRQQQKLIATVFYAVLDRPQRLNLDSFPRIDIGSEFRRDSTIDKVAYRYLTDSCRKNGRKPKRSAAIIENADVQIQGNLVLI